MIISDYCFQWFRPHLLKLLIFFVTIKSDFFHPKMQIKKNQGNAHQDVN